MHPLGDVPFSAARILKGDQKTTTYGIAAAHDSDVRGIFKALTDLPGLKGKKANMVLRDFYELGVWPLSNVQLINIMPDNRLMRVALRTAIIRPALGKLLNSLLDQFDLQYVLATTATEAAFREVWKRTAKFNGGKCIVNYPGRLDELIFRLADPKTGCCKPNAMACKTHKKPPRFAEWAEGNLAYDFQDCCPFEGVCPASTREMLAPYAIQNNTWMSIFTGKGGGGGLRGV